MARSINDGGRQVDWALQRSINDVGNLKRSPIERSDDACQNSSLVFVFRGGNASSDRNPSSGEIRLRRICLRSSSSGESSSSGGIRLREICLRGGSRLRG